MWTQSTTFERSEQLEHHLHPARPSSAENSWRQLTNTSATTTVRVVRERARGRIGLVTPSGTIVARGLWEVGVDDVRVIRPGVLLAGQFPERVIDEQGSFSSPIAWRNAEAPL